VTSATLGQKTRRVNFPRQYGLFNDASGKDMFVVSGRNACISSNSSSYLKHQYTARLNVEIYSFTLRLFIFPR